jgi:hypothetical protein
MVFVEVGRPLKLIGRDDPTPAPGEARLKALAREACRSDVERGWTASRRRSVYGG